MFLSIKLNLIWFANLLLTFEVSSQLILIFFLVVLVGLSGILINWNNLLFTIFSIEIVNIAVIISLAIISKTITDLNGYIYSNVLLWVTATEAAISLGILVALYKFGGSIKFSSYLNLKG